MSKHITEDGEIVDDMCEECAPVFFKTPYNHNRDTESERVALNCKDKTLTDQSFKEDTDINNIMARALKTGQMPIALPEHFGNADDIPDLFEARCRIAENNATFYKLDADTRAEFQNDPSRWEVQVMKDLATGNIENLARMGIDVDLKPPEAVLGDPPAPKPPEGAPTPPKAPSGA